MTDFLERWQRSDLEIRAVEIKEDAVNPVGDFVRGRATARLTYSGDPPFAGPHRRGLTLVFDSTTGQPLSVSEKDRVVAIRGVDGTTQEDALRTADAYVRENWHGHPAVRVGARTAYCASRTEIVESIERDVDSLHRDPINAYWCLVATYSDPPGSWVAVRMSDGKVLWSSLSP